MTKKEVTDIVLTEVTRLAREQNGAAAVVSLDASLIEDLAFDSMNFIDLTVRLERALGREEFSMQEWQDAETRRSGKRYTIASLIDALLAAP